jgi:hypothetical protein
VHRGLVENCRGSAEFIYNYVLQALVCVYLSPAFVLHYQKEKHKQILDKNSVQNVNFDFCFSCSILEIFISLFKWPMDAFCVGQTVLKNF